jgi:hypothetical protein
MSPALSPTIDDLVVTPLTCPFTSIRGASVRQLLSQQSMVRLVDPWHGRDPVRHRGQARTRCSQLEFLVRHCAFRRRQAMNDFCVAHRERVRVSERRITLAPALPT